MVSSQHDKPAKGLHYMQEALPREELMSSPLASASESVDGGKPKRKPTVTPRTFTRFFTPRSSLEKRFRSTSSRQALQDITTPAINRNARLNTPTSQKLEPFADVKASERENGWSGRLVGTKRKRFASPDSTVGGSSPLKKKRTRGDTPIITGDFTSDGCSQITGTEDEVGHEEFKSKSNGDLGNVGPIRRRMWSGTSGRLLERSLSSSVSSMTLGRVDHCGG